MKHTWLVTGLIALVLQGTWVAECSAQVKGGAQRAGDTEQSTLPPTLRTPEVPSTARSESDTPLRIGSKRFTESYILAELLAQQAAPHTRVPPQVRQGLGNTAIVLDALRAGQIDLYAEYAGTIAQEILKAKAPMTLAQMQQALAPQGLGVGIPLGFNDGYALALRAADAQRLGLSRLSDLAAQPQLKLGLSNEFIGRADGWKGLAARYGLKQTPMGLDHGLAYDAIAAGQIDVMDIYTTDAKIDFLGLRVLIDDQAYFPRYDAVVLYRLDVPVRHPQAWAALQQLEGRIDEPMMIAMNARAELKGVAFDVIARDQLAVLAQTASTSTSTSAAAASGTSVAPDTGARGFWAKLWAPDLARLARQHVLLVAVAVGLASVLGIPLALLTLRSPRLSAVLLGATGLLQTVPSIALLAVLISVLGVIGTVPALIALTLYAFLPVMRNTAAGLHQVPPGLRQAALSLGLTPLQCLRWIELPLALPTIVAGVRTATAIAIGTATIAAFVGAGGFGERIVTGLALNDRALLLAGALPAALLALVSEGAFELWERRLRRFGS
jgi:osmoprotectant transport system permease protein